MADSNQESDNQEWEPGVLLNPSEATDTEASDDDNPFNYSADPAVQDLVEQESAGSASSVSSGSPDEVRYLNNQADKPEKPPGRLARLIGKKDSAKRKLLFLLSGSIGIFGMFFFILVLFMVISGFGNKQVASIMDAANMSRLHYMSYRRTSQMVLEKSLNPDADGFRVTTQGRSLVDRLQRFDPNKVLSNLRQDEKLAFVTKDGERRLLGVGPRIQTSSLEYVVIGEEYVETPRVRNWHAIENYRSQREFVRNVEDAVARSGLFAEKSSYVRTKVVNSILEASDIKLYRFVESGRRVRTFKDAIVSAYERLTPTKKPNVTVDGAREADDAVDKAIKEASDETVESASQLVADAQVEEVKKIARNPAKSAAGVTSLGVIMATTWCTARDYINGIDDNAKQKTEQYKRAGALVQSMDDQLEAGDVTTAAVMNEAKRWDGFIQSRTYQKDIGNVNYGAFPHDLSEADSPVADVQKTGTLYNTMFAIREAGNAATFPAPSSVRDGFCGAITSTGGAIATAVIENVVFAILSAGSGGGAGAGKVAVQQSLRQVFMNGVRNFGKEQAIKVVVRSGVDISLYFVIDLLLNRVMGRDGNAAAEDGQVAYGKSSLGTKLLANETMHAMGGRTLSSTETAQLNRSTTDQRLALARQRPLASRLLSLNDPYSIASQTVASLPSNPGALRGQSLAFLSKSLNPVNMVALNSSRLVSAATQENGSGFVYANGEDEDLARLRVPTIDFSPAEREKMINNPDFWPLANAAYVESRPGQFEDLKDCFGLMTENPLPKCSAELLSSDRALHYRLYLYDGGLAGDDDNATTDPNAGLLGNLIYMQEVTD